MQGAGLIDPADQLIGLATHGGHDDGDLMTGIDLALHVPRGLPNTLDGSH